MSAHEIQSAIPTLFYRTDDNINGVMLGLKRSRGVMTGQRSLVFSVTKKLPATVVSADALIPAAIEVDGVTYVTDVVEREPAMFSDCENSQAVIAGLSGSPHIQLPMRGGQEIIQFPGGWRTQSLLGINYYQESYSTGTLGFFGVDAADGNVVGVTNTHVVVEKLYRVNSVVGNRTPEQEALNPFNIYEPRRWVLNGQSYSPGAMLSDNGTMYIISSRIKRYQPFTRGAGVNEYNEVDAALIEINDYPLSPDGTYLPAAPIIAETSYRIWEPYDTDPPNHAYLPFATTAELDALDPLAAYETDANPRLYFTGTTSGRKGYGTTDECKLKIWAGNGTFAVEDNTFTGATQVDGVTTSILSGTVFKNIFEFRHVVEVPDVMPSDNGDSGSAILADIDGVRKIVGLLFAGQKETRSETIDGVSVINTYGMGLFCRIDKVAEKMNVQPWLADYAFQNQHTKPSVIITDYAQGQNDTLMSGGKKYYQVGATMQRGYPVGP